MSDIGTQTGRERSHEAGAAVRRIVAGAVQETPELLWQGVGSLVGERAPPFGIVARSTSRGKGDQMFIGVLGTAVILLLIYAGAAGWPLWVLVPCVAVQVLVSATFSPGKAEMLMARSTLGRHILMGIPLQAVAAALLYGAASLF